MKTNNSNDDFVHKTLKHACIDIPQAQLSWQPIIILKCMLFFQLIYLVWKFCTFTFLYGAVFRWHHKSKPSFAADSIEKRRGNITVTITLKFRRINLQDKKKDKVHIIVPSMLISWIANRKIIVQIIPRVILRLPSTISGKRTSHQETSPYVHCDKTTPQKRTFSSYRNEFYPFTIDKL